MALETAEMEKCLSRLKTDLTVEAEMREATGSKAGGARWRSSRTDRGSVRAYAKDVKFRHHHELQQRPPHGIFASSGSSDATGSGGGRILEPQAGTGARAAAALRNVQQRNFLQGEVQRGGKRRISNSLRSSHLVETEYPEQQADGFGEKEVSQWSVRDTLEWLDSLALGKHRGAFEQNEISGPILLEVGLDDLDYMKVHVLAHRKLILKGIEELRTRSVGATHANKPPPPAPATEPPSRLEFGDEFNNLSNISNSSSGNSIDRGGGKYCTANDATLASGIVRSRPSRQAMARAVEGRSNQEEEEDLSLKSIRKLHWSHAKPLSENRVQNNESRNSYSYNYNGGRLPGNLVEEQQGDYTERSTFAGAIAQWRGDLPFHRQSTVADRAPVSGTMTEARVEVATIGAPKPALHGLNAERKGLLGVAGGTSTFTAEDSAATEVWTNPFAAERKNGIGATVLQDSQSEGTCGSSLIASTSCVVQRAAYRENVERQEPRRNATDEDDGSDDALGEHAEHEAFRLAVAEWRRGSATNSACVGNDGGGRIIEESRKNTASGSRIDTVKDVPSGISVALEVASTPRRTAEKMAEELREKMDADHRLQAADIEQEKRALLENLESARQSRESDQQGSVGHGVAEGEAKCDDSAEMFCRSPERKLHEAEEGWSTNRERGTRGGSGLAKEEDEQWGQREWSKPSSCSSRAESSTSRGESLSTRSEVVVAEHRAGGKSVEIELMGSFTQAEAEGNKSEGAYWVDEGESSDDDR